MLTVQLELPFPLMRWANWLFYISLRTLKTHFSKSLNECSSLCGLQLEDRGVISVRQHYCRLVDHHRQVIIIVLAINLTIIIISIIIIIRP